jgi:cytochrome bd ubiquinol oxidase subunit I
LDFSDALLLARLQFAFTIGMHIIFPAFTIGLASYLAVLNGAHLLTKQKVWLDLFDFWKKIFAVNFGMGVVSGIVMSYQFGTNWSVFSDKAGPVVGPLMGYEVLTAFFLEAGFLGVMLFGRNRVGPGLHFFATLMVAVGTAISAFWILSVNSWMQTPAGFAMNDQGQFIAVDWWKVIFNPSFPYRLTHMVLAAYLTTAFVVGAVAAWHLLKDNENRATRTMFSMAMWMAALVAPLQIAAGDMHGLNTLEYQPRKVAAMEGHFETQRGAPLVLFGIPNSKEERLDYKIEIPKLGSLILTHDLNGEIKGLNEWPVAERPPVGPVFYAFRIMVGIGFAMLGIGLWSLWLRYRGKLYETPWMHRAAILMGPSGFVAIIAGWTVTEVGRQPYTVYGHLTTAQSASQIDASAITTSLIAFIVVYFAVFGAGVFYMFREMAKMPGGPEHDLPPDEPVRAAGITPAPALASAEPAE